MSANNPQRDNPQHEPISCPDRDTQEMLREFQRAGATIEVNGRKHYEVRWPGKPGMVSVSGTSMSSGARAGMRRKIERLRDQ
jgi:hypothetical protein